MTWRPEKATWLAAIVSLTFIPAAAAYEVEELLLTGPYSNRINLAILGDGYTETQQEKLSADAKLLLDNLFQQSPFAEYRGLFNAKLVKVVSEEDGADYGSHGTLRNTALGARFDCHGIERLLCVDNFTVLSIAARYAPEYSYVIVIVNDTKYGGAGGQVATSSMADSALDVVVHELGHTIADLADEYEDEFPGFPSCGSDCPEPNATIHTDRALVKWNHWIPSTTAIPTPKENGIDGVGAFEGCRYQATGVYRPVETACMMRQLGNVFCPVCSEALTKAFWNRVEPIDFPNPRESTVTMTQCDTRTLSVDVALIDSIWEYIWSDETDEIDVVLDSTPTLSIEPNDLPLGTRRLRVDAWDATPLVRHDPHNLLMGSARWTVEVFPCGTLPQGYECTADDSCKSGWCVDGVCCESACSGSCQTCASNDSPGQCVELAPEHPECKSDIPGTQEPGDGSGGGAGDRDGSGGDGGNKKSTCASVGSGGGWLALLFVLSPLWRRRPS